jgi:Tol biopolymer transport system component
MKKYFLILFVSISVMTFPQTDYQLIISGSMENAVMNPIFSPDSNKIAYTKTSYHGIWMYDLQSQTTKQITDEAAAGFAFKWSADSKSILTRVAKYENMRRYNAVKIFNVKTLESEQLSDYRTMMPYLPQWIEGDTKVLLPVKGEDEVYITGKVKYNSGNSNLVVFEKDNKIVVKNLDNNSEQFFEPIKDAEYINLSTSPARTKIVFEVMGGNMFVMNIDGTNLIDLGKGNRPCWSFDSEKIIYMIAEDDGHDYTASDIFLINTDGTQKRNVTNTKDLIEMNPCFAPDGKSIVFDVVNDGSIYSTNLE